MPSQSSSSALQISVAPGWIDGVRRRRSRFRRRRRPRAPCTRAVRVAGSVPVPVRVSVPRRSSRPALRRNRRPVRCTLSSAPGWTAADWSSQSSAFATYPGRRRTRRLVRRHPRTRRRLAPPRRLPSGTAPHSKSVHARMANSHMVRSSGERFARGCRIGHSLARLRGVPALDPRASAGAGPCGATRVVEEAAGRWVQSSQPAALDPSANVSPVVKSTTESPAALTAHVPPA